MISNGCDCCLYFSEQFERLEHLEDIDDLEPDLIEENNQLVTQISSSKRCKKSKKKKNK